MLNTSPLIVATPPMEKYVTDVSMSFSRQSAWDTHFEEIATWILPFLGVRSLARVATLHMAAQRLVQQEVQRRQAVVADTEKVVASLLRTHHHTTSPPNNDIVVQIFGHHKHALALIDNELDWQQHYENKNVYPYLYPVPPRDPWFLQERCKFLDLRLGGTAAVSRKYGPSPLCLFPEIFFLTYETQSTHFSAEPMPPDEFLLDEMQRLADFLWRKEDYNDFTTEVMLADPCLLNRQDPLTKFQYPLADSYFGPCVDYVVQRLHGDPTAFGVFQKIAQTFMARIPASEDIFHFALVQTRRVVESSHDNDNQSLLLAETSNHDDMQDSSESDSEHGRRFDLDDMDEDEDDNQFFQADMVV